MWLSIGLDRRTPSEHLLIDIVEKLYVLNESERGYKLIKALQLYDVEE